MESDAAGAVSDAPAAGNAPGDVGAAAGTVVGAGADCITGCGGATFVTLGAAASAPARAPAAVCAGERFFAGVLAGAEYVLVTTGTFTVGRPAAVTGRPVAGVERAAPPLAGATEATRLVVPAPLDACAAELEALEPSFARVVARLVSRGSARTGNRAIGRVSSGSGIAVAGGSTIDRTVATARPA